MKPLAIAALLVLQAQSVPAQAVQAGPSDALIDRLIAVLPDREELGRVSGEIDAGELSALVALNPGKEAQIRPILQANLDCTGPAISAATLRMLRKIGADLGEARLRRLIAFYEGPDYAAFAALAARTEGNPAPSAADQAAMAKLMEAYPLKDFYEGMGRAEAIMTADTAFIGTVMKCASDQTSALEAAGLKSR